MQQRSAGRVGFAMVLAVLLSAFLVSAASAGDGDHHKKRHSGETTRTNTQATASATASDGAASGDTCTGSLNDFPNNVGVLSGVYHGDVQISGACVVNAGPTEVRGNLTITPGSTLLAIFGETNFQPESPASTLTVDGNIVVQNGGTAFLGCFATSSPCADDPNSEDPTLNSAVRIGGSLISTDPLGVVVHNGTIGGNVSQSGGGGGVSCDPQGAFAAIGPPVYSDYEDSAIGGSVSISGYHSCWLGVIRLHVGQSVTVNNNQLADPDAIEILSNTIEGNLSCSGNSMTWDSSDLGNDLFPRGWNPNTVGGTRSGQCEHAPSLERPDGPSPGLF
jgi:hypothetical protein